MTRVVTTVNGTRYKLIKKLGRGGQGTVFSTDSGGHAVKLLCNRSPAARESLDDRLAMVSRLPIEDLAIARPIDRLREPDLGYVMELYTGMVPIGTLSSPPKGVTSLAQWYQDVGGLRRRLRLLARTADLLAQLHGRGLVYTDPSPQNVFVSEATDAHEVRLIDTDNLRAASVVGQAFYTPKYGAPELVTGRGPATSLSDAHAFAVLAFQTLALAHPLIGDLVTDGEPEIEEQALNGELPWIDDPTDERNRSRHGIPRELVLSTRLAESFAAAFGTGLVDPIRRPGLSRWAEYLHRAADNVLLCPECTGSFYRSRSQCPWCDAPRPAFVSLDCVLWDPERHVQDERTRVPTLTRGTLRQRGEGTNGKERGVDSAVLGRGEAFELTDRFIAGDGRGRPQLRVRHAGTRLVVEALVPGPWRLVSLDGRGDRWLEQGPAEIPLSDGPIQWFLRTGESRRLHRIIRFRQVQGA